METITTTVIVIVATASRCCCTPAGGGSGAGCVFGVHGAQVGAEPCGPGAQKKGAYWPRHFIGLKLAVNASFTLLPGIPLVPQQHGDAVSSSPSTAGVELAPAGSPSKNSFPASLANSLGGAHQLGS